MYGLSRFRIASVVGFILPHVKAAEAAELDAFAALERVRYRVKDTVDYAFRAGLRNVGLVVAAEAFAAWKPVIVAFRERALGIVRDDALFLRGR